MEVDEELAASCADGLLGVRDRAPKRIVVRRPLHGKGSTPDLEDPTLGHRTSEELVY